MSKVEALHEKWFWCLQRANSIQASLTAAADSETHAAIAMEHWNALEQQREAFEAYSAAEKAGG